MRLFKGLRYTAVGIFFAGILQVVQACSFRDEGAGILLLLLILNFCTGPVSEEPANVALPPLTIDTFTGGVNLGINIQGKAFPDVVVVPSKDS